MSLKGLKVAILVEDYFDERELIYPYYRFKEAGAEVVLVGPKKGAYRSKVGLEVTAEEAADPSRCGEFHVVYIPGGYAPDRLRRSRAVLEFVRGVHERRGYVVAVCHGPWLLISSGLARGREIAAFRSIHDDVKNAGAKLSDKGYSIDGRVATATDPETMVDLFRELIPLLERAVEGGV